MYIQRLCYYLWTVSADTPTLTGKSFNSWIACFCCSFLRLGFTVKLRFLLWNYTFLWQKFHFKGSLGWQHCMWRHKTWSTLVQVMVAWRHPTITWTKYWPIISEVLWYSLAWGQFHIKCSRQLSSIWVWKLSIQDHSRMSQGLRS